VDRSRCRLSKEEYKHINILCGYDDSDLGGCYRRYTRGEHDSYIVEGGNVYSLKYATFVRELEQAEKVKLLQEALDL